MHKQCPQGSTRQSQTRPNLEDDVPCREPVSDISPPLRQLHSPAQFLKTSPGIPRFPNHTPVNYKSPIPLSWRSRSVNEYGSPGPAE
jgi:hypothetical protein